MKVWMATTAAVPTLFFGLSLSVVHSSALLRCTWLARIADLDARQAITAQRAAMMNITYLPG